MSSPLVEGMTDTPVAQPPARPGRLSSSTRRAGQVKGGPGSYRDYCSCRRVVAGLLAAVHRCLKRVTDEWDYLSFSEVSVDMAPLFWFFFLFFSFGFNLTPHRIIVPIGHCPLFLIRYDMSPNKNNQLNI